jgi:hypothetical protein
VAENATYLPRSLAAEMLWHANQVEWRVGNLTQPSTGKVQAQNVYEHIQYSSDYIERVVTIWSSGTGTEKAIDAGMKAGDVIGCIVHFCSRVRELSLRVK